MQQLNEKMNVEMTVDLRKVQWTELIFKGLALFLHLKYVKNSQKGIFPTQDIKHLIVN